MSFISHDFILKDQYIKLLLTKNTLRQESLFPFLTILSRILIFFFYNYCVKDPHFPLLYVVFQVYRQSVKLTDFSWNTGN